MTYGDQRAARSVRRGRDTDNRRVESCAAQRALVGRAAAKGRPGGVSLPFDPQRAELFKGQLSFGVAHRTDRRVNEYRAGARQQNT